VSDHQRFTVDTTAYLRNLDREDLQAECIAIHVQNPPTRNEATGTTSFGLRFPALIIAGYLEDPREVADRIAAILNEHWEQS